MADKIAANNEKKQKVLSLIQPSGTPTLGNYLGALKNWKDIAEQYDCAFGVADLHSITVRQEPAKLREQVRNMYALLLAINLDPEKNIIFIQSQVPTHAQLAWILNCYTQFGEMSRMTQFKDKSKTHTDNINVGLFAYPALMAADILLYQANFVPVGADQKQHLEITRDIAERFNGLYGPTFVVPEPLIMETGGKIMSLQEPTKKMSKSDSNPKSFISMLDKPDMVMRKFKSAVTDSDAKVEFKKGKDGVNNLMGIYSCCTGKTYDEITAEFEGKGYGDFKVAVAESVIEELRPVQESFEKIIKERAYLEDCMKNGAEIATKISQRTLDKVMKKIGFYQFKG
ncbi:MAG: tryptophan--tRNA ligase [Ruminococcaceae bacterium]|nr:tryptophan--tRNA ligase [Oscillospiraceae bacterium]